MEDFCPKHVPCRHCGARVCCRPLGLCRSCHANTSIRLLYAPPKKVSKYHPDEAVLPKMKTYPDLSIRSICPHGRKDGECPLCEKAEREGLTFSEDSDIPQKRVPRTGRRKVFRRKGLGNASRTE